MHVHDLLIEYTTFIIPYRHGFQFSEANIFRVPNGTIQGNSDLLVSYYVIYPAGIQGATQVLVPRTVLLNTLNDRLDAVVASTGVPAVIEGTLSS